MLESFRAFYRELCDERDAGAAGALWAADEDVVLVGSDATDASFGPAALHAHLAAVAAYPEQISFTWDDARAHVEGDAAWVSARGTIVVGERRSPYQSTGIFVRRGERWLWHTHSGSEPRPG